MLRQQQHRQQQKQQQHRGLLGQSARALPWRFDESFDPYQDYLNTDNSACHSNSKTALGPGGEVTSYALPMIQADSPLLPKSTVGKVVICMVDSGVWGPHPEFQGPRMALSGCRNSSGGGAAGRGTCAYNGLRDYGGHGTHVTGIASAQKNEQGVVGVIPGGAEVFSVR